MDQVRQFRCGLLKHNIGKWLIGPRNNPMAGRAGVRKELYIPLRHVTANRSYPEGSLVGALPAMNGSFVRYDMVRHRLL